MPIISVWDNENSRWKRNAKKTNQTKNKEKSEEQKPTKQRKERGGTEAIVKGWELHNFVVHLS